MEKKIRIVLADDHTLIRSGIKMLLSAAPDISIVGEASNGEEAIQCTRQLKPDVIVIDLSMPKMSGIDAVKIIRKKFPETKVLVLTMHEKEEYVMQIFKAGASGYVVKTAGREELTGAIRAVANGERYFSARVSEVLVEGYTRRAEGKEQPPDEKDIPLTRREKEILVLVAEGLTNQEIGKKLFISHRTVDTHRTNIMQKLDIHDVANLVRYAVRHGIVTPDVRDGDTT
jgi:DNA-binding NarL/FixJ family response regulator